MLASFAIVKELKMYISVNIVRKPNLYLFIFCLYFDLA